ncbi:MAG: hypothetical protein ABI651_00300 [Verrucomicrobiota bacterium]
MASSPKQWRLFNARWLDFNSKVRQCVDRYPRHSIRRKLLWLIVSVLDYLEFHLRLALILYNHPDPATLVVIDRSPWDQIITPERAVLPGGMTKLLVNLFPNPAFVVLCAGASRKIYERKQDMTE